jgi:hypothetical protein
MEEITKYFLNVLEILEAELKLFKLNTAKVFKAVSFFGMGVFLLGMGVLFLAWTLFKWLVLIFGPVPAGLITSLFILLLGGMFIWQGKKSLK